MKRFKAGDKVKVNRATFDPKKIWTVENYPGFGSYVNIVNGSWHTMAPESALVPA
jgi:hypothetical protein